jgi:ribose transport system substrate-binding protein
VPAIEAAAAAGIPVLTVDRGLGGTTPYVGTDNVAASRAAGEYLFEAMGGSGKVIEIEGDPSWAMGRTEGFGQALDAAPGITLVGQETARDDPSMARLLTADLLETNPDVTGIFVHTDAMTPGVLQAVADSGLTDKVAVVSLDGAPEMLPAVKDGTLAGTLAQRPDLMGQQAVEAAIQAASGETVEAFIPVETTLVTQDNVDEIMAG